MMEERPFFSLKVTFDRRNILRSASVNGKPLELFDILKEDGSPAGIVRERGVAHLDGSLHPTSHIWIVRRNHSSGWDLLLQKRSLFKDSNPGCYDISSAGHVSAGDTYLPAALRELGEELGIRAEEKDLHLAGMRKAYFEDVFYGKPFRDYEISAVYVYDKPVDEKKLVPSGVRGRGCKVDGFSGMLPQGRAWQHETLHLYGRTGDRGKIFR